ncbi:uncharacterized protein LOC106151515 [Lingula anatina]|uniref:Uncharacterized protein LOC106151515 n=1 Tax=Lingula anatina TaxID=7574 RepID=A0A1S3H479_LINAN|nr:uncharacterized protein LOC106151515 [Lingula anatina]|eukprot:XP_013380271.1 uncharacterized protein LOC106151515 [Lingula anatina]
MQLQGTITKTLPSTRTVHSQTPTDQEVTVRNISPKDDLRRRLIEELDPDDSVSQAGSNVSFKERQLEEEARQVALKERLKYLTAQQEIEEQQIRLEQRRKRLLLESELNESKKREEIFRKAMGGEDTTKKESDSSYSHDVVRALEKLSLSRLPIPEPPVFEGNYLTYVTWRLAFKTLIESRNIPPSERLYYLKRYLRGEAKETVDHLFYLDSEEAYIEALEILEDRYGDKFLIAEAFRDKLEKWPKINSRDSKGLRKLSDFLRQCLAATDHVGELKILDDCRENRKLLQKLPEWITRRWA